MTDFQDDYGHENDALDAGLETNTDGTEGYIDLGDGQDVTFGDGVLAPDGDYGVNTDGSWD